MRMTRLSLAALLGGLLACGSAAIAQDTNAPSQTHPKKGASVEQRMQHLDDLLNLTDAEKPKVKAALEDFAKGQREARDLPDDQRRDKRQSLRADLDKQMKAILTTEQYDKYLGEAQKAKKKKSDSST